MLKKPMTGLSSILPGWSLRRKSDPNRNPTHAACIDSGPAAAHGLRIHTGPSFDRPGLMGPDHRVVASKVSLTEFTF
jgi:hypothetical protein